MVTGEGFERLNQVCLQHEMCLCVSRSSSKSCDRGSGMSWRKCGGFYVAPFLKSLWDWLSLPAYFFFYLF